MALDNSSTWNWYRPLTFADKSGSSADYQVKIRLYSGAKTLKDRPGSGLISQIDLNETCVNFPNDIRFGTTSDPATATQLDQWLECSGGKNRKLEYADYWVELPTDGSNTFYLFTNNSSAPFYSSGEKTFMFFEHFKATSAWTTTNAGGHFTISGGTYLCLSGAINDNPTPYHAISKDLGSQTNTMMIGKGKKSSKSYTNNAEHFSRLRAGMQKTAWDACPSSTIEFDLYYYNALYPLLETTNNADTAVYSAQPTKTLGVNYYYFLCYPYSGSIWTDGIGTGVNWGVKMTQAPPKTLPRYVEICIRPGTNLAALDVTYWDWLAVGKYVYPAIPSGSLWGSWTAITAPVIAAGGGVAYISCQNTASGMYTMEDYSLSKMSYLKPGYKD